MASKHNSSVGKQDMAVLNATALPISQYKEKIQTRIRNQAVTFIEGKTGCGKSAMVPQYIADDCKSRCQPARIIVTQPRRIACVTLARTVAKMRGTEVGDLVGYQIGGDVMVSSASEIVYSTTGFLVQSLIHNVGGANHYTHIVLDEVHERDLDIDLLACVVRELMKDDKFKVILMSATLEGDLFFGYFSEYTEKHENLRPINIEINRFPIEIFHIEQLSNLLKVNESLKMEIIRAQRSLEGWVEKRDGVTYDDYLMSSFKIAVAIIENLGEVGKTILVFLPGMAEIEQFNDILFNEASTIETIQLVPLHSRMNREEQEQAFGSLDPHMCRVITATNIAETSVTLPNVHVVIDLGLQKGIRENLTSKITQLVTETCSQAACRQRAGRTGRLCSGIVVRLYSTIFFNCKMKKYDIPHVSRVPLESLVLNVKFLVKETLPLMNPKDLLLRMIAPPAINQIEYALSKLASLGAIEEDDELAKVTAIGILAHGLPIDVEYSRLVFFGIHFHVPCDAIVMAAVLSTPALVNASMQHKSMSSSKHAERAKDELKTALFYDEGEYSGPLMGLNVFKSWLSFLEDHCPECGRGELRYHQILTKFCDENSIRKQALRLLEDKVLEIVTALTKYLSTTTEVGKTVLKFGHLLSKYRTMTMKTKTLREKPDGTYVDKDQGTVSASQLETDQLSQRFQDTLDVGKICNDFESTSVLLKVVFLAAFNRNIVFGRTMFALLNSPNAFKDRKLQFCHKAIEAIKNAGFDPKRSIAFKCKENPNLLLHGISKCVNVERQRANLNGYGLVQFTWKDDVCFKTIPTEMSETGQTSSRLLQEAPLMVHVVKRIASGTDFINFKFDCEGQSKRVMKAHFYQPFSLVWKHLTQSITGFIDRKSLIGNASDVRENALPHFAVMSKYTGTRNANYATFDNMTLLPYDYDGTIAWLFILCFHPGNCDISVQVMGQENVIVNLKIEGTLFGPIDPKKSPLKVAIISDVNRLRKVMSHLVAADILEKDREETTLRLALKLVLDQVRLADNLEGSKRCWVSLSTTNLNRSAFPPWTTE